MDPPGLQLLVADVTSGKVDIIVVYKIDRLTRCGSKTAQADEREGLISGRYTTLRSIATEERCDKSYVSCLLSVAFLAPDIFERILIGDHAATLTPERLRKACPLPQRWDEQRVTLLD